MALTYNTLNALTREEVIKQVTDNIFNDTPLLQYLRKNQVTGKSGTKLQIPLSYARNTNSGSYSGADTFLTNSIETATKAELNWKDYYVSVVYTGDEKDQNKGKNAVVDLIDHKLENARMTMSYNITAGIFGDGTGNSNKDLTGLKAAVDDGTNYATYAGIERLTDATWWKAKYTALNDYISLPAMQSMYGDLTDGSIRPDMIVTTQDIWDDLWEIITPIQRSDSEKMSANYGFRAITFNGTPVVADAQCTAGYMYFLNSKFLKLYPMDGYDSVSWTGWKQPTNQDVGVGQFIWKGQLAASNCRYLGRIVSITT
jgi:hypothetical protein